MFSHQSFLLEERSIFCYLGADLVATLSDLQMHYFTHDVRAYGALSSWGSLIVKDAATLLYSTRNDVIRVLPWLTDDGEPSTMLNLVYSDAESNQLFRVLTNNYY